MIHFAVCGLEGAYIEIVRFLFTNSINVNAIDKNLHQAPIHKGNRHSSF